MRSAASESSCASPPRALGSLTGLLTIWAEKRLTTETIEGDVVWLENTTAKVVRGKNVTVGTGLHHRPRGVR